jgi:hypothetical protein
MAAAKGSMNFLRAPDIQLTIVVINIRMVLRCGNIFVLKKPYPCAAKTPRDALE